MKRFRPFFLAALVLVTSQPAGAAARYRFDDVVNALPAVAPGPKPDPGDVGAYAPYLETGHATLSMTAIVRFKNGTSLACDGGDAVLLPDTPYVRWALATYVASAKSTNRLPNGRQMFGERAPHELDFRAHKTAIRRTSCSNDGHISFTGVPPGDYFSAVNVQGFEQVQEQSTVPSVTNNGVPIGPPETETYYETYGTDGFILLGGPYHVPDDRGVFDGKNMSVAAHFGWRNYR